MKVVISLIITILSYISIGICSIWSIVSFLIYLVKDIPFNWWSLWSIIISIVVMIVSLVLTAVFKAVNHNKVYTQHIDNKPKSRWELRLEEAIKNKNK